MNEDRKLRILLGKVGLDGHDRGVIIVARALRDAGFEVIYTGLHNTPETVVEMALQEDVDALGISVLSGAHNHIFSEILRLLEERGIPDKTLFGGGIIPKEDIEELKKKGVSAVFEPGASTDEITSWIRENVEPRELN